MQNNSKFHPPAHITAEQLKKTKQQLINACKEHPMQAGLWARLGNIDMCMGNLMESIDHTKRAIALAPENFAYYSQLGATYVSIGDINSAIDIYMELVGIQPNNPVALNNLGSAYATAGKFPQAIKYFRKALKLDPQYFDSEMNLAASYRRMSYLPLAIETYLEIRSKYPDELQPAYQLANTLVEIGDLHGASGAYQEILTSYPGHIKSVAGLANTYERLGKYEKAYNLIKAKINNCERDPQLLLIYGKLAEHFKRSNSAINLLKHVSRNDTSDSLYPKIKYQLAKLYETQGDYSNAFKQYNIANLAQNYIYVPNNHSKFIDATINVFSHNFFSTCPKASVTTCKPIFIVGMPRSGTSLTEQILSNHPSVSGAGELRTITDLSWLLPEILKSKHQYPYCVKEIDLDSLNTLSKHYMNAINTLYPHSEHVTDKLPHNFLYLGLISLMFPNARVIHCRRNAIDTCLSIYCNHMNSAHAYSTDLAHIASHYLEYERLMLHWKTTLPLSIFDISYEELISNPELNIRNLLEFCGLEWDPHCLVFYKSDRYIKTLSYNQVRIPLHNKSVDKWKVYKIFLGPLLDQLSN